MIQIYAALEIVGDVMHPAQCPPGNKTLLRDYYGIMVVNIPLIRPYFPGGRWHWGVCP